MDEMRPVPPGFAPYLRRNAGVVEWIPPEGSECRALAYYPVTDPMVNELREVALRDAAWQSLEIERITGKAPVL